MKGKRLGEFEELVLLTIASMGNDAYAVELKHELERLTRRKYNISAVHSVLYRLEKKGFLTSYFGGATNKRGGKEKRFFQVANSGFAKLQESKYLRQQLWKNIPQLTFTIYGNQS